MGEAPLLLSSVRVGISAGLKDVESARERLRSQAGSGAAASDGRIRHECFVPAGDG